MLEPVARELVVVRPIGFDPLRWVRALAAEEPVPGAAQLMSAACSLPGVLLSQVAAMRALIRQGMDFAADSARRGRRPLPGRAGRRGTACRWRQGRRAARAGAADRCGRPRWWPGGAGSRCSATVRRWSRSPTPTPTESQHCSTNSARTSRPCFRRRCRSVTAGGSAVIAGTPEQLTRFELHCQRIADAEAAERKNKLRGGAVFNPTFEPVRVDVGFHSPRLADAVELVDGWAATIGLDAELAHDMAHAILVHPVDWVNQVTALHEVGRSLDPGPGPRRHPDPADRPGDPRSRCRDRARGDPRRSAQPVHRRGGARSGQAVVELRADRRDVCPTAR